MAIPALTILPTYRPKWGEDFTAMSSWTDIGVSDTIMGAGKWIAHTPNDADWFAFSSPDSDGHPFSIDPSGGGLTITAQQDGHDPHTWFGGWSGGLLSSMDGAGAGRTQKYGYFEISMVTPDGNPNSWPAFWLIDKDAVLNPALIAGEIDIHESYGNYGTGPGYVPPGDPTQISMGWHQWSSPETSDIFWQQVPTATTISHQYGVDIEPTGIDFYIDRVKVWSAPVFAEVQREMVVLLNLAIGGGMYNNLAGDGYDWSLTGLIGPQPVQMSVQYVAVWASPNSPDATMPANAIGGFAVGDTAEVSFATISLFGFVFTYADGTSFYSGTVADDGTFGIAVGSKTTSLGTYTIFSDGVTTRAPGSVVLDRFNVGDASFVPQHGATGVDGNSGLGSENSMISVNGAAVDFGASHGKPALRLSVQVVPPTPAPSASDVITAEINEVYQQVLGRVPDAGGLATYTALLNSGTRLAALRKIFTQSAEAQGDLNTLYQQVLGRDADSGGLSTYTDALAKGTSLSTVQLILGQSQEAHDDLNHMYQDILARDADGGGLATYMGLLANGTRLSDVRGVVAHSPEAKGLLKALFKSLLGRDPGNAELVGMEDLLATKGNSQGSLKNSLSSDGGSGAGATTITASAGDATLTDQPKTPTVFLFGDIAFGHDTIVGFDKMRDQIQLSHNTVADVTTVLNETTASGGDSLITLNSILLTGVNPTTLGAANFVVV